MNTKTTKGEVLTVDTDHLKMILSAANRGAESLNSFMQLIEEVTGKELTDTEKLEIYQDGIKTLINKAKVKLGFPNADSELIGQMVGIDYWSLQSYEHKHGSEWATARYEVHDGRFIVAPNYEAEQKERCITRVTNQVQEDALKLAREFVDIMVKLDEAGYINKYTRGDLSKIVDIAEWGHYDGFKLRFQPNMHAIKNLS